jgi:hypothetical protein
MVNENMGFLFEEELNAGDFQPSNLLRNVEGVAAAIDIVMLKNQFFRLGYLS